MLLADIPPIPITASSSVLTPTMEDSPLIPRQPQRPSFFCTRVGEFVLLFFILYYTLAATILLFIVHGHPKTEVFRGKSRLPSLPSFGRSLTSQPIHPRHLHCIRHAYLLPHPQYHMPYRPVPQATGNSHHPRPGCRVRRCRPVVRASLDLSCAEDPGDHLRRARMLGDLASWKTVSGVASHASIMAYKGVAWAGGMVVD